MPRYVVERNIPGLGDMSPEELKAIAQKSNEIVRSLDADYTWIESYVTDDKMYCVHEAPDPETIREHARRGGFPVDRVTEVQTVIGPKTAE